MCFVGTTITEEEKSLLQKEAKKQGISVAELFRRKILAPLPAAKNAEAVEVMDIKAAADFLLISVPTLTKMCQEKKLPSFKMGGKYRFLKSDLEEHIKQDRMHGVRLKKRFPEFLTPHEVSNALNVSPATVYKMISSGQIASVRVGNRHRIRPEAVDQLIEAG